MKKLKLRPWVKEALYIIAIAALILCAIKINGIRMEQQKNDQISSEKVAFVNKN